MHRHCPSPQVGLVRRSYRYTQRNTTVQHLPGIAWLITEQEETCHAMRSGCARQSLTPVMELSHVGAPHQAPRPRQALHSAARLP